MYYFDQSKEITPTKKPIYLSRQDLQPYHGKYKILNEANVQLRNLEFDVLIQNKQLLIKSVGMPDFYLFPESKSRFFTKETEASIEFIKNNTGIVEKMVVLNAGAGFAAVKISP